MRAPSGWSYSFTGDVFIAVYLSKIYRPAIEVVEQVLLLVRWHCQHIKAHLFPRGCAVVELITAAHGSGDYFIDQAERREGKLRVAFTSTRNTQLMIRIN